MQVLNINVSALQTWDCLTRRRLMVELSFSCRGRSPQWLVGVSTFSDCQTTRRRISLILIISLFN